MLKLSIALLVFYDTSRSYGVEAHYLPCDLRNVTEIHNFVENVLKLYPQGIDILMNNAGSRV